MHVVVTGANGHIGANLVRGLLSQGHSCRALVHRKTDSLEGLDIEICRADILQYTSLLKAFKNADIVYHLAGRICLGSGFSEETFKVNVGGTRNVVQACIHAKVGRLVHFSSIQAFSRQPKNAPLNETRGLVKSKSAPSYDLSKSMAIQEVHQGINKGLDSVILHPTGVIGPYDFAPSPMGRTLIEFARRRINMVLQGGFNWVDSRDVANGAIAAGIKGRNGQSYILGGHWASLKELAGAIQQIAGTKGLVLVAPKWAGKIAAPISESITKISHTEPRFTRDVLSILHSFKDIDLGKGKAELDYQPRPLISTFQDTIRWFSDPERFETDFFRKIA